jgi:hypothetical protein
LLNAALWERLATVCRTEWAAGSIIITSLQSQLDVLQATDITRGFFPEQPYQKQIEEWEKSLVGQKKEREKAGKRLAYFKEWYERMAAREGVTTAEAEGMALAMADKILADEEK